jgi:hypothetical protein
MQYYNSGTMLGCDGNVYAEGTENFLTALACIQLQGGLSPSQIGLGLPASTSATGSGYVSPSVVNAALDCLASGTNCGSFKPSTTYPSIRGAIDWSPIGMPPMATALPPASKPISTVCPNRASQQSPAGSQKLASKLLLVCCWHLLRRKATKDASNRQVFGHFGSPIMRYFVHQIVSTRSIAERSR